MFCTGVQWLIQPSFTPLWFQWFLDVLFLVVSSDRVLNAMGIAELGKIRVLCTRASFPGKQRKSRICQRWQSSVWHCITAFQSSWSLWRVTVHLGFFSSLSQLYTESQLEVSEERKYSIVFKYFKDEADGMGKIIDKYMSWYWRPQKWRPFVFKNFHDGKQKFLSSVVWRWKLKCMRIKSLT